MGLFSLLLAGSVLAADLPATETGTASAGLIELAKTGNPEGLQRELGGAIEPSGVVAEKIGKAARSRPTRKRALV